MSHRRKSTPSYLPHKQSGRARAVWTDALGVRQQKLLTGPFDSPKSRTAFAKLHLELATAPLPGCHTAPTTVSVNEVLLAHLGHAERHYRRADGSLTHEVDEYRLICRSVRELYGTTPAAEFGPLALKVLRQKMIEVGWCRSLINQRIGRIRRAFRWGVENELVSPWCCNRSSPCGGCRKAGRRPAKPLPSCPWRIRWWTPPCRICGRRCGRWCGCSG